MPKRKSSGIDQRKYASQRTNAYKAGAGRKGAAKLMANARRFGATISGVARLPAEDDAAVLARIEMLGKLEDARKAGMAPMRDVVTSDRLRLRVTNARKVG